MAFLVEANYWFLIFVVVWCLARFDTHLRFGHELAFFDGPISYVVFAGLVGVCAYTAGEDQIFWSVILAGSLLLATGHKLKAY